MKQQKLKYRVRGVRCHEVQQHSHQWWQIADTNGMVGEQKKVTLVPTCNFSTASCTVPKALGFLELNMVPGVFFQQCPLFLEFI